jgi:hypothetical protein
VNVRRVDLVVTGLAVLGWLLFGFITWFALAVAPSMATGKTFQVDWNVYATGGRDLLHHTLYRVPLDANGAPLSSPVFNLPPLSALWAVPLLALPSDAAGYIWQLVAAASIATTTVITLTIWKVRRPVLLAGIVLGPLSITLFYLVGIHVATNNYFMLALVAGGCLFYLRRRDTLAGLFLGLAIATKLWPITILIFALREKRWRTVGVACGLLAVQGLAFLAWLGVDSVAPMISAFGVDIPPTGYLIGPSAFETTRGLWNGGLGALFAIGILALPLRGRSGMGIAIIAGLAPITNLWIHYAPTVFFGLSCTASALRGQSPPFREPRSPRGRP